jgi:hypothetical protein
VEQPVPPDTAVRAERGQEVELRVAPHRAALGATGDRAALAVTGARAALERLWTRAPPTPARPAVWTPAIAQRAIAARAGEWGRPENAPATRSATQPQSAPHPIRCAAARRRARCPTSASRRASASADDSDRTGGSADLRYVMLTPRQRVGSASRRVRRLPGASVVAPSLERRPLSPTGTPKSDRAAAS